MEQDKIDRNSDELNDELPDLLKQFRQNKTEIPVPEGYFDSLSQQIFGKLSNTKTSFMEIILSKLHKPMIWSPVAGIIIIFIAFIFIIQRQKPLVSEQSESINEYSLATDASFSEEVFLVESNNIESDLTTSGLMPEESILWAGLDQLTAEEMAMYLKDQDIEIELLTEN